MHIHEVETFYHVQCALFIGLEMGCLDMVLIGFLGGVDLEDANLATVFLLLHRVDADDTWLFLYGSCTNVVGKLQILFEIFRIDLNFAYSYNHSAVDIGGVVG